jgi:hypothetical protein
MGYIFVFLLGGAVALVLEHFFGKSLLTKAEIEFHAFKTESLNEIKKYLTKL